MSGAGGGPSGSNVHMVWERLGIQPTPNECLDEDPKSKRNLGAGEHASLCQNIPMYLHNHDICPPIS